MPIVNNLRTVSGKPLSGSTCIRPADRPSSDVEAVRLLAVCEYICLAIFRLYEDLNLLQVCEIPALIELPYILRGLQQSFLRIVIAIELKNYICLNFSGLLHRGSFLLCSRLLGCGSFLLSLQRASWLRKLPSSLQASWLRASLQQSSSLPLLLPLSYHFLPPASSPIQLYLLQASSLLLSWSPERGSCGNCLLLETGLHGCYGLFSFTHRYRRLLLTAAGFPSRCCNGTAYHISANNQFSTIQI